MLILIVRHAQAGEHDPTRYPDDTERPLTKAGKAAHASLSGALAKRGLVPEAILSSPWKRAWQTAEIMAEELSSKKNRIKPRAAPALAQAPDLEAIKAEIAGIGDIETVALVGHEPWLSELASLLLAGDPNRVSIDLPKSGVVGIETAVIEGGNGTLRFFLRPKQL
jgi:phosphohistidine phosphatase